MEDTGKEPMTYRQIKEYVEGEGLDFGAGGYDAKLAQAEMLPDDPDSVPWGVWRWLTHEVLPTIRRNGGYEWPEILDIRCEFTVLQTGRYITEPVEKRNELK
jgi:hypothetical protein